MFFEARGTARFQNPSQTASRNGVIYQVGQRVSMMTRRQMPAPDAEERRAKKVKFYLEKLETATTDKKRKMFERMIEFAKNSTTCVEEPTETRVYGTITAFEATAKKRPCVQWDEQPAPYETPSKGLVEYWQIDKE
jgi:hypothetical protein